MALLKWLIGAAATFGGTVALIYVVQRSLMYFPQRLHTLPAMAGLPEAQEPLAECNRHQVPEYVSEHGGSYCIGHQEKKNAPQLPAVGSARLELQPGRRWWRALRGRTVERALLSGTKSRALIAPGATAKLQRHYR